MSKFIMMVGLPGSGKTTFANHIKNILGKDKAVVLSSDDIREELFGYAEIQDKNHEVFEIMNKRTQELLNQGKHVIYDATNINRRRRKHVVNHVAHKANEKIVYYMNEHYKTITHRNANRDRVVPGQIINRMYKSLQIPVKNEGWDDVRFVKSSNNCITEEFRNRERKGLEVTLFNPSLNHDDLITLLSYDIPDLTSIYNLPQDSTYHSFSVSRHTYYVFKHIQETYEGEKQDKLKLLWAALFHDLGKAFCKSFVNHKGEETRYANFKGHEFVSSQKAAYELSLLGYDDQFIQDVSALVQFHMVPKQASEKKLEEARILLGDDLFDKLMILDEADKLAK